MHVAIIGAGIFGTTIAQTMSRLGNKVVVYDDKQPEAGTRASGFLMKPSWFSKMNKEDYSLGLGVLDTLYGLEELTFRVKPSRRTAKVFRVPPHKVDIARVCHHSGRMIEVRYERVTRVSTGWLATANHSHAHEYDVIIVAAGYWTPYLIEQLLGQVSGKKGIAFRYTGVRTEPFIQPWAPYKQIVACPEGEHVVWAGDGTAIKPENWTLERQKESELRVQKALGAQSHPLRLLGIRPVTKQKAPCLLEEFGRNLWAVTGGSKNGTLAAGWAAGMLQKHYA